MPRASGPKPLNICIIDMNDGHPNQAMRCMRLVIDRFIALVHSKNPGLPFSVTQVSPRDMGDKIPRSADLYLSSGGPGSPYDGDSEPWFHEYMKFLHDLSETAKAYPKKSPSLFAVCYSFELVVRFFGLARVAKRNGLKFGVMPIYTTETGQSHPLTSPFQDRLFAFEHRRWEVIDLDEERLKACGGHFLAKESRDGFSKGRAILGLDFGPGIEGVQFHPEADKSGVMSWIKKVEHAEAFRQTYGESTFRAMLRTLENPNRVGRTFDLFIPRWMARRFNAIADDRGWASLDMPVEIGWTEKLGGKTPSRTVKSQQPIEPHPS